MKINLTVASIAAAAAAFTVSLLFLRRRKAHQLAMAKSTIKKPRRHLTNVFHNAKAHSNGNAMHSLKM